MKDQVLLKYLEGFISEKRKRRFISILAKRTKFLTVAIEDVRHLHNTSAIVRSCDSFGIQEVHSIESGPRKRLDKNIAMGAQKWVDVYHHSTAKNALQDLKSKGYQIVATSPHKNQLMLDDFRVKEKTALFFGAEKNGLSPTIMENADTYLTIPMYGFTESLNISVSASIVLQRLSTELRKSNLNWQLTHEEMLSKRLDWTKKSIKGVDDILNRFYLEHK